MACAGTRQSPAPGRLVCQWVEEVVVVPGGRPALEAAEHEVDPRVEVSGGVGPLEGRALEAEELVRVAVGPGGQLHRLPHRGAVLLHAEAWGENTVGMRDGFGGPATWSATHPPRLVPRLWRRSHSWE